MFRKKYLFKVSIIMFLLFLILLCYSMYSINSYNNNNNRNLESNLALNRKRYSIEAIEEEIKLFISNLPLEYKENHMKSNVHINNFLRYIRSGTVDKDIRLYWAEVDQLFINNEFSYLNNSNIGNLIKRLKTTRITAADIYTKGTQLKFILKLEGNHLAVFKPQWYHKEKIISGHVYSGKDRYGSEILGFYLAAILELEYAYAPIAVERLIHVQSELLPVASALINSTTFHLDPSRTCIYGKCFYCKPEEPVCTDDAGYLKGAVIYHLPIKMDVYRSPWQRTYKIGKKAEWETNELYCQNISSKISHKRLLDLIDVSIFDFLIQNGDRHHYETYKNKMILIDNGKGLGNPYVDHFDILAPLFQCCSLRTSTWNRLKSLSGGYLKRILTSIPDINNAATSNHLQAIDERLLTIYATVERCKAYNNIVFVT